MKILDHLKNRYVDLDLYKPILSEEVATFYLYNLSGQIVGYQQYRPEADKTKKNNPKEGRYYTYISKDKIGVFGLESLHLTPGIVFVTEGIFDSVRLTKIGLSSIATLCNSPSKELINFIRSLGRQVIVVCDSDEAGKNLSKSGDYSIVVEGFKDLGEASDDYVNSVAKRIKQVW